MSLRGFCRSHSQSEKKEDNQSKKRRLLEAFFEKKKGKKAGPSQKFTGRSHTSKIGRSEKEKTKKVQLGWKHFKGAVSRQSSSFCLILPITRPQSLWNIKYAKKLQVNDKIRDPRQTNVSPEHYF